MTGYDYLFKILVIGDPHIGKTSISDRFVNKNFDDKYVLTIGVEFRATQLNINGKIAKIHVWDTAGQERFRAIAASYYKGSHGVLICYDITNYYTFEHLTSWLSDANNYADPRVCKILIGTKCDVKDREVSYEEGKEFADKHGMPFFETSAKNFTNIDETFNCLCQMMCDTFGDEYIIKKKESIQPIDLRPIDPQPEQKLGQNKKKKCCL